MKTEFPSIATDHTRGAIVGVRITLDSFDGPRVIVSAEHAEKLAGELIEAARAARKASPKAA